MTASWWQTLLLSAVGGVIPFAMKGASGQHVNLETVIWAVVLGVAMAASNLLRSPLWNPPSIMVKKDGSQ